MTERPASISLQFFEGAIWSAARNLLQIALNLIALAIVARELGPQSWGVYGIAMLVISVAEMLAGGALTDSIVQRKDLSDGHIDATFWLSSLVAVALAVLIAVFAQPLAHLAGGRQAGDVLFVLAWLLPVSVGSRVPMALLSRNLRFRAVSQIGALATILSCSTGIVLALRGTGIWTLVAMEAVRAAVNLVGAFAAVSWRPGLRGRRGHLRDLWAFNAGTLAAYTIGYVDLLLPRLLVSHLMGAHALGLFLLATRVLTEMSTVLTAPLHAVAMAACARLQEATGELHRLVLGLYRTSRLLVFPSFLGMAALAPYLIPALFGPRWQAAVPVVQILMLEGLRLATGAFNTAILFGLGHVRAPSMLFAAGIVLQLILFPALAPWGVVGAALAMLGRQFGNWPLACVLIRRATGLPIRRQIGGGLAIAAAAGMAAASAWALMGGLAVRLPAGWAVACGVPTLLVVYVAALRWLLPDTLRTAWELVKAFVRRDRQRLETLLSQDT